MRAQSPPPRARSPAAELCSPARSLRRLSPQSRATNTASLHCLEHHFVSPKGSLDQVHHAKERDLLRRVRGRAPLPALLRRELVAGGLSLSSRPHPASQREHQPAIHSSANKR